MKTTIIMCLVFFCFCATVHGQDCNIHYSMWQTCLSLEADGETMDLNYCETLGTQQECEANDCYWNHNTQWCQVMQCTADADLDQFTDGGDLNVLIREYGRTILSCKNSCISIGECNAMDYCCANGPGYPQCCCRKGGEPDVCWPSTQCELEGGTCL